MKDFLNSSNKAPQAKQLQQSQQAQTVNQQDQETERTYVPSTTPVAFTTTSGVDKALEKSDRIMEHANKVLKDLSGK